MNKIVCNMMWIENYNYGWDKNVVFVYVTWFLRCDELWRKDDGMGKEPIFYSLRSNRLLFHPLSCDVSYLMECSGVVFYPLNEICMLVIVDEK